MDPIIVTYIISDIDKALAFEWIAEGLNQEKYKIKFILILQKPAYLSTFLENKGIQCECVYFSSKKDYPKVAWKVIRLLMTMKPSIVHCHLFTANLIGLFAAKLLGIRHRIYTRHHSDFHHRYFPKGIKYDKLSNRLATKIVAPSEVVRNVLVNMEAVVPEKIKVINHGFDLSYFSEPNTALVEQLKIKYQTQNHYPVIGVIARFTELKGIQYIIPAYQRLLDKYPNAKALFFNAKGDFEIELKQMLSLLPVESYELIPFEKDLSAAYQLMDIFIQASTDYAIEAFGQTYVEALAARIPSIFTLSGVAAEFIKDGENALVVPFKDSDAIYQAMMKCLSESGLTEKLKEGGWNSVQERFALHKLLKDLEHLYDAG